jgi:hypothetical protein
MTLEAVPLEYTRCFLCKNPAQKKVAYKGALRLVCNEHLKKIAEELNEEIKIVVVKYDEQVLNLPPIVSRNPEMEGMNCWNARDPEVQKKIEHERNKYSEKQTKEFDKQIELLVGLLSLDYLLNGESKTKISVESREYEVYKNYACKREGRVVRPVYRIGENGKLIYLSINESESIQGWKDKKTEE